ncbi:MAG: hypothetical protein B7X01_00995 [Acidiphilium sp. 21-62-4]|nr:MAG: hypothetical protein B7X01_00995 [Acidiphilium sp. 21-62-4]
MKILVLLCLLVSGCSQAPARIVTRLQLIKPAIPRSLLTCPAMPPVPQVYTQADVARYLVALWQNDALCQENMKNVAAGLNALRQHQG